MVISVVGPNGPEAFADLDLTNSTTGEEIVLVGDHADHLGIIRTYVPTDTFDIAVDAPQGSVAESFHQSNGVISGPLNIALSLGMKTLRLDASSLGTMTIQPNGTLAVNLTVQNMTATTVPATMQVVVRLPSGVEIAVFPTLAIDFIPNQSLTIPAALVPIPNVPATQFGREIRLLFRARSRASGQVLDQASVKFVIE